MADLKPSAVLDQISNDAPSNYGTGLDLSDKPSLALDLNPTTSTPKDRGAAHIAAVAKSNPGQRLSDDEFSSKVAPFLQSNFPGTDLGKARETYNHQRNLEVARDAIKDQSEGTAHYLQSRSIPWASRVKQIRDARDYQEAVRQFQAGNQNPDVYNTIAGYERIQQIRREQGAGGDAQDFLASAPSMLGEMAMGSKAVGAVGRVVPVLGFLAPAAEGAAASTAPLTLGGAAQATGAAAGRLGANLALNPSMYLDSAVQNSLEKGGNPLDAKNLAPAVAHGALTLAILGNLTKGVPGTAGGGVKDYLTTMATRAGVGIAEQAGIDVAASGIDDVAKKALGHSVGLDTHYGTIGTILRGENDGLRQLTGQALMFSAFAMMHGREPDPIIKSYQKSLKDLNESGLSGEGAAKALAPEVQRVNDLLQSNPDRATAKAAAEAMPPGFGRDVALKLAEAMPEAKKPEPAPLPKEAAAPLPEPAKAEAKPDFFDGLPHDQLLSAAKQFGVKGAKDMSVETLKKKIRETSGGAALAKLGEQQAENAKAPAGPVEPQQPAQPPQAEPAPEGIHDENHPATKAFLDTFGNGQTEGGVEGSPRRVISNIGEGPHALEVEISEGSQPGTVRFDYGWKDHSRTGKLEGEFTRPLVRKLNELVGRFKDAGQQVEYTAVGGREDAYARIMERNGFEQVGGPKGEGNGLRTWKPKEPSAAPETPAEKTATDPRALIEPASPPAAQPANPTAETAPTQPAKPQEAEPLPRADIEHEDFVRIFEEAQLTARERHVVKEVMAGRTLEEIGADQQVRRAGMKPLTRERIRQIKEKAFDKIRGHKDVLEAEADDRQTDKMTEDAANGVVDPRARQWAELAKADVKYQNKLDVLSTKMSKAVDVEEQKSDDLKKLATQMLKEAKNGRLTPEREQFWRDEAARIHNGAGAGPRAESGKPEGVPGGNAERPGEAPVRPGPVESVQEPAAPAQAGPAREGTPPAAEGNGQGTPTAPAGVPAGSDVVTPQAESLRQKAARWKAESLKDIGGLLDIGAIPSKIPALAKYVASQIVELGYTLADFTKAFIAKNGEAARPYIKEIWQRAQEFINSESNPASIKNSAVDADRAERGLPPIEAEMRRGWEVSWDEAKKRLAADPALGLKTVEDYASKPRAFQTEVDQAVVLHERMTTANLHDKAILDVRNSTPEERTASRLKEADLADRMNLIDEVARRSGTEMGRALNARKMAVKDDFTLSKMMLEKQAVKGGELTDAEHEKVVAAHAKIAELQAKVDAYEAQRAKPAEKPAEKPVITPRAEAARASFDSAWQEFAGLAKGKLFSNPLDPQLIGAAAKVAKEAIKLGVAHFQDFVDQIAAKIGKAVSPEMNDVLKEAWKQASEKPAGAAPEPVPAEAAPKPESAPVKPLNKEEGIALTAQLERAKQDFRTEINGDRKDKGSLSERMQDLFVKWRRGFILSSPATLAKLTAAAAERLAFTPVEEATGGLLGRAFPKLAAKAMIQGGINLAAEAKAVASAFGQGMKDAWQTLKTGKSDLDVLYGPKNELPRSFIDYIGSLHGALKAPVKRAAFERAFAKGTEWATRNGLDASDLAVQTRIGVEAYKEANRSIFMQDNAVVDAYNSMLNRLEAKNPATGQPSTGGKALATGLRALLPVVKVPTNIVAETFTHVFGSVTGLYQVGKAYAKGIESLPTEQADSIMRQLKKGSLGAAMLTLGYLNPSNVGGFYQQREKRDKADADAGGFKLFGFKVPAVVAHNPLLEAAQVGATVRRVADSKGQGTGAGAMQALLGLAEQVPFVRETAEIGKAIERPGNALNQQVKTTVVPAGVDWAARMADRENGETVKRYPQGLIQTLQSGIPGLRNSLPSSPPRKKIGLK